MLLTSNTFGNDSLQVLPPGVTLRTLASSQQLLVQEQAEDQVMREVRTGIIWSSSNPDIATVSANGVVTPLKNGTAKITASVGNRTATTTCVLSEMEAPVAQSFQNDILPILTKAGCNMGACHGALAGKGGFRLSLRGYDAATDYFNIVSQDRGRRVEFADPGRSLILTKPSGGLPHKGGLRLNTESDDYRTIAEWIAHGAVAPLPDEPTVASIEIFPQRARLLPGSQQRLIVRAVYTNGRERDVTRWVKWTSANDAICQVDEQGVVKVTGSGEGAVSAWFNSQITVARITVPFQNEASPAQLRGVAARNFIDQEINAQLKRLNLPASPECDDATFIRRCYLDTIGLPPTIQQTQEFLADTDAAKRNKLIDELLERPEFVDYWTYKWSDILMLNGTLLRPNAIKAYYQWIHQQVEKNTPWDQFVTQILTAKGNSLQNGATNFYALFQSPEEMTENACQAFLGLSIGCAKCHNHPLEKWTNDQYYGMANLFARVRAKGWGGDMRSGDGVRTLYVADSGELIQPRTGKPQLPTPLDGDPIPFEATQDRRVHLAKWLTSPDNPYFSKSITNRIWANFFGAGLVQEIDDMRVSNPASNEELLNKAAAYLVAEKFNLKSLMREIMRSSAYQRSSLPIPGNETDKRFYSTYLTRRLNAEVLHDAISQATEVPSEFKQIMFPGADAQKTDFYPVGTRAIQLYDSAVDSYFLKTFGRNQRNIVCECERSNEPSMVQVLHISNGTTINDKLESSRGRVARLFANLQNGMAPQSVVDEAYLACLSRYPTLPERNGFVTMLEEAAGTEQRYVIEDMFWALLSSREFVFNH